MLDGENSDLSAGRHETIERDVSGPAVRDPELTEVPVDAPADQWMSRQNVDRADCFGRADCGDLLKSRYKPGRVQRPPLIVVSIATTVRPG